MVQPTTALQRSICGCCGLRSARTTWRIVGPRCWVDTLTADGMATNGLLLCCYVLVGPHAADCVAVPCRTAAACVPPRYEIMTPESIGLPRQEQDRGERQGQGQRQGGRRGAGTGRGWGQGQAQGQVHRQMVGP